MNARGFTVAILAIALLFPLALSGNATSGVSVSRFEDVSDPAVSGNQVDPRAAVFGGAVHLFWSGRDLLTGEGADSDIYHATFDGEWSEPEVLTHGTEGNDETPFPIAHGSLLYLFWSSDDDGTTGAEKRNIVVATFDGGLWSEPVCVSSSLRDEGAYNEYACEFAGDLWVFFMAWSSASGSYEIACAQFDGAWHRPIEITSNSDGWNANPCAAESGGEMVVAWQSADSVFAGGSGGTVIASKTFDGSWSATRITSPADGSHNTEPCIARGSPAYLFWLSDSDAITAGGDTDVVFRIYDGAWDDKAYELTADDDGEDGCLEAVATGHGTVVSWVTDGEPGVGGDTDVVFARHVPGTNASSFTAPILVSKDDGDTNDGGGVTQKAPAVVEWRGIVFVWEANASPTLDGQPAKTWIRASTVSIKSEGKEPAPTPVYFWFFAALLAVAVVLLGYLAFKKGKGK